MLLIRNLKQIVVMLEPDLPYAGFSTFWEFIMTKFMPTRFKFRLMFMLSLLLGSGWLGGVFASPHALKAAPALQAATPTALPPSITLQKTVYAGHNGSAGCSGSTETIAAANNAPRVGAFQQHAVDDYVKERTRKNHTTVKQVDNRRQARSTTQDG